MAVNVSKSGGIYIEISADVTALQKSLKDAEVLAKASGKDISESLFNAITPQDAARVSQSLNRYFKQATQAAAASKADLGKFSDTFREMGKAIGVTGKDLAKYVELQKQAYQVKIDKAFLSNLRSIQKATGATNDEMNKLAKSLGGVGDEFSKASKQLNEFSASSKTVESELGQMTKRLTVISASYFGTREIINMSSAWTDLSSRIRLATKNQEEAALAMGRISTVANRSYASLESTAESFLSNATAFKDLGYSVSEQLGLMEAMTDALVVSGAKGQKAEAVIHALSKAMMAGKLKGENWNTVLQQGGRVVTALADGLGVSISKLRDMAAAGDLTSEKVFEALTSQMSKLKEESESMPATINDAFVKLGNTLTASVGQMDSVFSASTVIVKSIDTLGISISVVAENIKPLIATYATWKVATIATGDAVQYQIALLRGSVAQFGYAQTAVKSFKSSLGGVVSVLGGPWVVGLTAAAGAIAYLATRETEAEQASKFLEKALKGLNPEIKNTSEVARVAAENIGKMGEVEIIAGMQKAKALLDKQKNELRMAEFNTEAQVWVTYQGPSDAKKQIAELGDAFVKNTIDLEAYKKKMGELVRANPDIAEMALGFIKTAEEIRNGTEVVKAYNEALGNTADTAKHVGQELAKAFDPAVISKSLQTLQDKLDQAKRTAMGQSIATELMGLGVASKDIDSMGKVSAEAFKKLDAGARRAAVRVQVMAKELYGLNAAAKDFKAASAASFAENRAVKYTEDAFKSAKDAAEQLRLKNIELQASLSGDTLTASLAKVEAQYKERIKSIKNEVDSMIDKVREWSKQGVYTPEARDSVKKFVEENKERMKAVEEEKKHTEELEKQAKMESALGYRINEASLLEGKISSLTKAYELGEVSLNKYNLKLTETGLAMMSLHQEQGFSTFAEDMTLALAHITEGYKGMAAGLTESFGNFYSDFTTGFSNSIGQAVVESKSLEESLYNISNSALSSLISSLVQLGMQYMVNAAIGQSVAAASVAATTAMGVAQGAALATAYAPAAAAASLASFGGNAAPAALGITSTYALTESLSSLSGFKTGGYTGNVPVDQVAGVVHGKEFVFDAVATSRIGLPALEALRSGVSLGNDAPVGLGLVRGGTSDINLSVSIENYGSSKSFEVEQISENEIRIIARDEARATVYKETPNVVANNIANPNSPVSKALNRNTRTERRR